MRWGSVWYNPADHHDWKLTWWHESRSRSSIKADPAFDWKLDLRQRSSTITGPRQSDGSLRASDDHKVRLQCPKGHRLNPREDVLDSLVADALERRLPYVEIPE